MTIKKSIKFNSNKPKNKIFVFYVLLEILFQNSLISLYEIFYICNLD